MEKHVFNRSLAQLGVHIEDPQRLSARPDQIAPGVIIESGSDSQTIDLHYPGSREYKEVDAQGGKLAWLTVRYYHLAGVCKIPWEDYATNLLAQFRESGPIPSYKRKFFDFRGFAYEYGLALAAGVTIWVEDTFVKEFVLNPACDDECIRAEVDSLCSTIVSPQHMMHVLHIQRPTIAGRQALLTTIVDQLRKRP